MVEKFIVTGAEIVQPWFAIGSDGKSVFRAFTVASKQVFAVAALFR